MANRNHAGLLSRSVSAILQQERPAEEVIIVDDASTDDSWNVLEAFASENPTIRILRNGRQAGAMAAFNRGLELATGTYLYPAAADDEVHQDLFSRSLPLLDTHPAAALCCSIPEWRDARTGVTWSGPELPPDAEGFVEPAELIAFFRRGFAIAGHTSVVRRADVEAAGGYVPELKWHSDWFGLHVMALRHGICYVHASLATMRVAAGTFSRAATQAERRQVVTAMLDLLASPSYADVRGSFRSSGLLGNLGLLAPIACILNARHWRMLSTAMVARSLRTSVRSLARRLLPERAVTVHRRRRGPAPRM
jgi:hypothetical protein